MNKYQHLGFTLLELMATVSIIAILAALAVPSFTSTLERRRIVGAAERLQSDLRWARAEAIKRNKPIRVTFAKGDSWKYTIDTIPPITVTDPPKDILPKTVNGNDESDQTNPPLFPGTNLASNVNYNTFDPARGINLNNGTVTLSYKGLSLSIVASTLGRVRICGNTGGYDSCD